MGLAYFSSGTFFGIVADKLGVHRTTAMRAANKVIAALWRRRRVCLFSWKWASSKSKGRFLSDCTFPRFPGVVSAIDCTHSFVKPSVGNPEIYQNRKKLFFYWRSSGLWCFFKIYQCCTHGARIFDNFALCARFENGQLNGILLEDGGYGCKPYLLTPLPATADEKQRRYNLSHVRSRNVIERCFGVIKQRFQCLLRGMLLK